MKIRTGFVSNSSSSSFCLIGRDVSDKEFFDAEDVPDNGYVVETNCDGEGGRVLAFVNDKQFLKYLQEHRDLVAGVWESYAEEGKIKTADLVKMLADAPDEIVIVATEIDQGSTSDLGDFKEYYAREED